MTNIITLPPETLVFVKSAVLPAIVAADPWLFPMIALLTVLTLLLACGKGWARFAARRKWISRLILFVPVFFLAISVDMLSGWAMRNIPVQIAFESPNLTTTAIKLGLYNLFIAHEEDRLLPETRDLRTCIATLSYREASNHAKSCAEDDAPCVEALRPPIKSETVIAKIRESQASNEEPDACKNADLTKF